MARSEISPAEAIEPSWCSLSNGQNVESQEKLLQGPRWLVTLDAGEQLGDRSETSRCRGPLTSSAGSRSWSQALRFCLRWVPAIHHRHRVADARRQTPAPHPLVRPGRGETERIRAVDQRLIGQLAYRNEDPIILAIWSCIVALSHWLFM